MRRVARITSGDVARESGVSRTTVSYVLNGKDGAIPESTRERVRAAAARLEYAPSAAARALRSGRSDVVLCVLPDWPIGPVLDALLEQLAGALAERGLVLLVHHGRDRRPLADLWRAVTPRAVVGLTAFAAEDERAMRRAGIEVLTTLRDGASGDPGAFAAAQERIGRLQARHLLAAGHARLGYAHPADPRVADFAEHRLAGVRAECAERHLAAPVVQPVHQDVASAVRAVRAWRAPAPAVTGIAAYNDEVGVAVLAGLRAEGLRVPGDVAVIGVDDVPAAALAAPPLTTVTQSGDVQARHLAARLLAALDDEPPPPPPADVLGVVPRESA